MKALSIRQPWAWLIVNGYKDLENRDWRIWYKGKVLIHAAKTCTRREYGEAVAFAQPLLPPGVSIPPLELLPRGGIVGMVEIVDCVHQSSSPWFVGPYAAVLAHPKTLELIPLMGQLGFFDVPRPISTHAAKEAR